VEPPLEYWIIYGLLVIGIAWWARQWGRHVAAWMTVAFFLTPLVAALGLLIKGRQKATGTLR
jgi:hypothetical protein